MNLVVGATGLLGLEICRQLAARDKPLKALVRPTSDPAKREELQHLGATLAEGDLKDRSSLQAACQGVTAVISTAAATPSSRQEGDSIQTVDREGQLSLVEAAEDAGAEHFIFVSFRKDPDLDYPLDEAKRAVEQRLMASGMTHTILQASYFMEVWLSPAMGFDYPNGQARIYGEGRNGLSWVSFKDVAQFAVAALDHPAARNAVIEVGGPEVLSPLEVVRIFEEVGGQTFEVERVPEEALRAQKESATDPLQETLAGLQLNYARGDPIEMERTLQAFPLPLTSVRDYAEGVMASA